MTLHPRRLAARVLVLVTTAAAAALISTPSALAWYPDTGITKPDGPCHGPIPQGEISLERLHEPQEGHTGPWSPWRTVYASPTNVDKQSTQRRAVSFRVADVSCQGTTQWVHYVYSRFEERTMTIGLYNAGDSSGLDPLEPTPTVGPWHPVN